MAHDWLERDDLAVFVVAGAPKGFGRSLTELLANEHEGEALAMKVDGDLTPWILARVRGEYRQARSKTPASEALWRAFRALAAARYHVRGDRRLEKGLKELRDEVEQYWMEVSPMHRKAAD